MSDQHRNVSLFQQARLSRDPRFDGLFFIAVKSTGIFCRTICPATLPKEENVEYFSLAQQAMSAGYRPCLRCRPDSAPQSFAWKGVETTLERGMQLLQRNPEQSIQAISNKLGISDRYFRQLFQRHLGISPKQYQLFAQLLFAKQLLHQTHLSIEQISQAVGFHSARLLQAQMRQNMQLTPKQIRRQNRKVSRQIEVILSFRPPYAWEQVRDFFAQRAIPGMERVAEHSYSRIFNFKSTQGFFCATYQPEQRRFLLRLTLDDVHHLKAVIGNIRRMLDLDSDVTVIKEQLQATGLSPLSIVEGIRLPGVWSTFEAGCRAVLGQQISVQAAVKLVTLLVHKLGEKQEDKFLFPTAQAVAQSDLEFLPMPNSRRQALRSLANFVANQPDDHDLQSWLAIKGVGVWTLAYAKMRGQSNSDIWLDTDRVIKNRCKHLSLQPENAAPWRSYLTFQLWSMS